MQKADPEMYTHADVLRVARTVPPGALFWLLDDAPDGTWNSGAQASAFWALVRRGLMTSSGHWTGLGRAVQQQVRRNRGRTL